MVALLEEARAAGLATLLFTGLTWDDVQRLPQAPRILRCVAAQRVARGLTSKRSSARRSLVGNGCFGMSRR